MRNNTASSVGPALFVNDACANVFLANKLTSSNATVAGFGTNTAIAPGNSYSGIPGSTGNISVNAATNGHRFTCVHW